MYFKDKSTEKVGSLYLLIVFFFTFVGNNAVSGMTCHRKYKYFASFGVALLLVSCGTQRRVVTSSVPDDMPQQVVALTTMTPQPVVQVAPIVEAPVVQQREVTWEERKQHGLDSLCSQQLFQTSQLGMYVYDLTEGRPLYTLNTTQRMRPASCQKLITSVSAYFYLGSAFQFTTQLCIAGRVSGGVLTGDVYVVGSMDPLLSRADVKQLAAALRSEGISRVSGRLYVDLSMKDDLGYGWGWSWDDDYGPLSALMVDCKDQFASLWVAELGRAGIQLQNKSVQTKTYNGTGRAVAAVAHSIDEVMIPMLKKSENIFAECVFYQIAACGGQKAASRKHAQTKINSLITQLGLPADLYTVADGSGLSPYNYVTPELLVAILNYAYSQPGIFERLYADLPIAGVDGTLEKRMLDTRAAGNVHAKTGTVTGVSSLAGYLTASNGHLLSFCILNQGVSQSALGRAFQDQVCTYLCN